MTQDVKVFAEQSRSLGITGILDEAPIPPRRKVSPKNLDIPNPTIEITNNTASTDTDGGSDDLIKFQCVQLLERNPTYLLLQIV